MRSVNDQDLLQVEGLSLELDVDGRWLPALEHVSFGLRPGEARGLVGESGSGKSLTLRAILGLLPHNARLTSGQIVFQGERIELSGMNASAASRRLAALRGEKIAMIFQEPSVALNPVITVGEQIVDALTHRKRMRRRQARDHAVRLMELVGIHDAASKVDSYPFELSGGLKQRIMIAAAVAEQPRLILCDEPTTALDVTVQKQILSLFTHLRDELDAGLLYVTHDLAVVAQLCDSLTVMYGGRVMESSDDLRRLLDSPRHPYTAALLSSTPDVDHISRRLATIPGSAPSLQDRSVGCPFAPRCDRRHDACTEGEIADHGPGAGRVVHCLDPLESAAVGATGAGEGPV